MLKIVKKDTPLSHDDDEEGACHQYGVIPGCAYREIQQQTTPALRSAPASHEFFTAARNWPR
jgi:hypothetical protein